MHYIAHANRSVCCAVKRSSAQVYSIIKLPQHQTDREFFILITSYAKSAYTTRFKWYQGKKTFIRAMHAKTQTSMLSFFRSEIYVI